MTENIPVRIASSLLNSLKGGVVPRVGLPYISVGRVNEINSLLIDINNISEGGSSFRFIEGSYGSGKSFLLQMMKSYAMDKGFVVVDADLSPNRRFYGSNNRGQGVATYKELIKNLSCKTKPDGNALSLIMTKWMNNLVIQVMKENKIEKEDSLFNHYLDIKIYEVINELNELVNGFDFSKLIIKYAKAFIIDDNETMNNIYRFIRGEYRLKSEAKADLSVSNIITDSNWYDYLKLVSHFCYLAGYSGMLVLIDELINIYKIPNSQIRDANYEMILMMYNEALQGKAKRMGFIVSSTIEALEDKRRGVFSYDALRSRLDKSRFTTDDVVDNLAPIIKLKPLTVDEVLVLLEKLVIVHSKLYNYQSNLKRNDLAKFLELEYSRINAKTMITPREIIRDFIEILNILYQYPNKNILDIIKSPSFTFSITTLEEENDDDFVEYEL